MFHFGIKRTELDDDLGTGWAIYFRGPEDDSPELLNAEPSREEAEEWVARAINKSRMHRSHFRMHIDI